MKMKKYFFGIIAFAAIVTAGISTYKDYNSAVYVSKSYSSDLQALGYANGAADYYRAQRADENGNIDPKDVQKSRDAVNGFNASKNGASGIYWTQMGPNFVGGRTRALLQDKSNPAKWYAGGVNGGVFITHDAGNTWHEFNSSGAGPDLSVSSFAQTVNGVLFVATGCDFEDNSGTIQNSGTPGNGLFRVAVDPVTGSPSYTKISTDPTDPNGSSTGDWRQINRIRANPVDNDKLYVGMNRGLRITTNAHASEVTYFTPAGLPLGSIDDIAVTSDGKEFWVVAGATIVHYQDNGGEDVVELDRGAFAGASRVCLEIAPSNDSVLYAAAVNNQSCLSAIYQSRDKGGNWIKIAQGGSSFDPYQSAVQCQGIYDNALAVDENNEGRIIVGGISLWEWNESPSQLGTGGWKLLSVTQGGGLFDTNYVHADKHRIVIPGNGEIWVASDGGIGKSIDNGKTWFQANGGYNVTQFYSVAAATGVAYEFNGENYILEQVIGGAQDNGTQLVGLNPLRPTDATEVSGGDGFDCAISNLSGVAFSTYTNGILYRSARNTGGAQFVYDQELLTACTADPRGIGSCFGFHSRIAYKELAHADMTLDSVKVYAKSTVAVGDTLTYYSEMGLELIMRWPSYRALDTGDSIMMPDFAQSRLLLATSGGGANGVYMSRDAAKLTTSNFTWDRIAGPESFPNALPGGSISDMKFTADGNQIYVVSTSGSVYRIDNVNQGNDSLSLDIRSGQSVITCTRIGSSGQSGHHGRMAVDPNDPGHIVLTIGGYGINNHVYEAYGCDVALENTANFVNIQGDLPVMPTYCAIIAEHDSKTVMVGTEFGVFMTENAGPGAKWLNAGNGLPKTPVYDMFQHTDMYPLGDGPGLENIHFRKIYLGTFGRGFYGSTGLVGIDNKNVPAVAKAKEAFELNIYPNPVHDRAVISLDLSKEENMVIEVFDLSGKIVRTVQNGSLSSGKKLISLDVSSLNNGTYLVSARSEGERKSTKLVVLK